MLATIGLRCRRPLHANTTAERPQLTRWRVGMGSVVPVIVWLRKCDCIRLDAVPRCSKTLSRLEQPRADGVRDEATPLQHDVRRERPPTTHHTNHPTPFHSKRGTASDQPGAGMPAAAHADTAPRKESKPLSPGRELSPPTAAAPCAPARACDCTRSSTPCKTCSTRPWRACPRGIASAASAPCTRGTPCSRPGSAP